jgi:hypothetical protein
MERELRKNKPKLINYFNRKKLIYKKFIKKNSNIIKLFLKHLIPESLPLGLH